MKRRKVQLFSIITLLCFLLCAPDILPGDAGMAAYAQTSKRKKKSSGRSASAKKSSSNKNSSKQSSGKKSGSKKKSGKGTSKKRSGKSGKTQTPAELRKQQEAAQREIKLTEEQIRENDKAVSKGISELRKLETDINASKAEVKATGERADALKVNIASLEKQIGEEQGQLDALRADYRKAVKKMRGARKRQSALAFIFSAKSFSEAGRRMRYLKDFSAWREKRTKEIQAKVEKLNQERQTLAAARTDLDATLRRQVASQQKLERQHAEQDAVVVKLRANGQALQSHLARKQAEANQLRSQVAALIAQEEAKRQKEEAAREAQQARDKGQGTRDKDRDEERGTRDEKKLDEKDKEKKKVEEKKKEEKKQARDEGRGTRDEKKQDKDKNKDKKKQSYAEARKRKPRGDSSKPAKEAAKEAKSDAPAPSKSVPAKPEAGASGFESMKGSLPKPVAGGFRVTSQFGRQSLPDLPDVVFDNPGIDAEVAKGATALAVYPGKVSAVYVVPGFSTVVIVNHGQYYTVYGNIASPSVKVGQEVKQGQGLGKLETDNDDPSHSTIHFEVWKKRDKLNPMSWIR